MGKCINKRAASVCSTYGESPTHFFLLQGTEGVNYERPPIGHPFFGPTQAIKSSSAEILARAGRREEASQQLSPAVAPGVPLAQASTWYGALSNTMQIPGFVPTGTYSPGPQMPPAWAQNPYYGAGPSYVPTYPYTAPSVPPPFVYSPIPSQSAQLFPPSHFAHAPHGPAGYPMHGPGAPHM